MTSEFWLAVVGMAITGITGIAGIMLTYRARTVNFREQLFVRQLDLVVEILAAYGALRDEMVVLFGPHFDINDHDNSWHRVRLATDAFGLLTARCVALLPSPLVSAFVDTHADAIDILKRMAAGELATSELERFVARGVAFANEARHQLGTDALSAETKQLLSQSRKELRLASLPRRAPEAV